MAKKTRIRGSISLIPNKKGEGIQAEIVTRPNTGQQGIFIPLGKNPSIHVKTVDDGTTYVNLDIEIVPTPNNEKSSHMVKLDVRNENREKFGLTWDQVNQSYTPIVGNLRTYPGTEDAGQPIQQPVQQPAQPGAYQGPDMPAEFDSAW